MKKVIRISRGFSLVEVTLALGIAAFCLLAIFGLIPVGLASNQNSISQTSASDIATMIVADLRNTPISVPAVSASSPVLKINIPASGSATHTMFFLVDGKVAGAVDSDATASTQPYYRAMMEFNQDQTPGTSPNTAATDVHLIITWPALGSSSASSVPKNFTGLFETTIALNRH